MCVQGARGKVCVPAPILCYVCTLRFAQPAYIALADECISLYPLLGEYAADFPLIPLNIALKAIICHRMGDMEKVCACAASK